MINYGIGGDVQDRVDAHRGNPMALAQQYSITQELVDLLALQQIKIEKEAAARDMMLKAQQGPPTTIAEQRESEVLNMTRDEILNRMGGTLQRQGQMIAQAQGPQPMMNQPQQLAQQGIASQSGPAPRYAQGGIVAFADGGSTRARDTFDEALEAEGITDPEQIKFLRAIYEQESDSGANSRTSNRGARGGMQIRPVAFEEVATRGMNIDNPVDNARAGIRYALKGLEEHGGDPRLGAAFYYGGPDGARKLAAGQSVSDPVNPGAPDTGGYAEHILSMMNNGPAQPSGIADGYVSGSAPVFRSPPVQPGGYSAAAVLPPLTTTPMSIEARAFRGGSSDDPGYVAPVGRSTRASVVDPMDARARAARNRLAATLERNPDTASMSTEARALVEAANLQDSTYWGGSSDDPGYVAPVGRSTRASVVDPMDARARAARNRLAATLERNPDSPLAASTFPLVPPAYSQASRLARAEDAAARRNAGIASASNAGINAQDYITAVSGEEKAPLSSKDKWNSLVAAIGKPKKVQTADAELRAAMARMQDPQKMARERLWAGLAGGANKTSMGATGAGIAQGMAGEQQRQEQQKIDWLTTNQQQQHEKDIYERRAENELELMKERWVGELNAQGRTITADNVTAAAESVEASQDYITGRATIIGQGLPPAEEVAQLTKLKARLMAVELGARSLVTPGGTDGVTVSSVNSIN